MRLISAARAHQILLGVALGVAAAGMALTGCGSSSDTTSMEATDTSAKAPARRATHGPPPPVPGPHSNAVAIIEPAPKGRGRIDKAELEKKLAQMAMAREMKVPKPGDKSYAPLRDEALGELITAVWLQGEAEERGLHASESEVAEALRKSGEVETLREAHYSRAAMLERAKAQLFATKIEHMLKEPANEQPSESVAEFDLMFEPKWKARTSCAKGFVMRQCANFRASSGPE